MTGIIDRLRAMQGMGDIQLKALMDGVGPQAADEIERLATKLKATEEDRARFLVEMGRLCAQCDALRLRIKAAEKERDALRAENERIDEAMESLLIRCDDSDSAMYGTLSTSFVRDTVRIARGAMEESK